MNKSIQKLHEQMLQDVVPSMRYQGGDAKQWQKEAREKLAAILKLPVKNCENNLAIEYKKETELYTEIRFTFESEKGYCPAAHLLVPKGVEKPKPIICVQGHSTGMHISLRREKFENDARFFDENCDYALQAVKNGYAAIALEQRAFGECGGTEKGPACAMPAYTALMLGRTLVGERVFDVMRLIDVVTESFSDLVDASSFALIGISGGGTTTIYASALDERIALSAPACAFSAYRESIGVQLHCQCNYLPGIAKYFDMGDVGALVAPRPLVITNGQKDVIFPYDKGAEQMEISKKVYEALGAAENIVYDVGPGGHVYYPEIVWPRINAFLKD